MSLRRNRIGAFLDIAVGMSSRASGQLVAFIVTVVAIPLLSPADFGIFVLASSFVAIVRTLLYSATFQYVMQAKELNSYSSECLVVSGFVGTIASSAPLIILFAIDPFSSPDIAWFFLILAPSNLVSIFTAWQEAQILRKGELKAYYSITAVTEIASAGIAIGLLLSGVGLFSLACQVYLRPIFQCVGYRLINRPIFSTDFSMVRTMEVARWALPQYGSMVTGLISGYGADFIVGATLSPAATGLFRAASRISGAIGDVCGQPLRIIAMTVFSRRSSAGLNSDEAYPRVLGLSILLPGTALIGLALISSKALPLLVSEEWNGVETIVTYLCLGKFFSIVGGVSTPLLVAYGRHRVLLPTQIAFATILVGGLLATASYGVEMAAIVTTVSATISGVVYTLLSISTVKTSLHQIQSSLLSPAFCALAANCSAFAVIFLTWGEGYDIASLALSVVTAMMVFVTVIYLMRRKMMEIVGSVNEVGIKV